MLKKGMWRENGGYIEKPPFPKQKTEVLVQELRRDEDTGEATLKLIPKYGDQIFYEVGAEATSASSIVENSNEFKTKELVVSFLCVDSTGEHETGEPVEWKNKITLKYRVYDKGNDKVIELRAAPSSSIKYTTDGSNPREHGGTYDSETIIPRGTTYVQAIAESKGIYSDVLTCKIDWDKVESLTIDKQKGLQLYRRHTTNDTSETYTELGLLKKHEAKLKDVTVTLFRTDENNNDKGWIELIMDASTRVDIEKLENSISNIRENFIDQGRVNISIEVNTICFKTGQKFLDWLTEKKKTLSEFEAQEIEQQ
jgi:hypothetical protein